MKLPEPAYQRLSDLQSGIDSYYTHLQLIQVLEDCVEECATAFENEADSWKAWPQAGAAKRKGAEAIRKKLKELTNDSKA